MSYNFNDFKSDITYAGKLFAKQTKKAVSNARHAINTSDDRHLIESEYEEIGRLYYEGHRDDEYPLFPEQFQVIREAEVRIAAYEASQAAQESGEFVCPQCGGEVPEGADFCPHCGSKVEKPEEKTPEKVECPNCHGENDADADFCVHCGAQLKHTQEES